MLPIVPSVMDKEGKMERQYDIYSRLLKDRVIMLDGEVRDELTTTIVSQLLFLEAENPGKPIWMYVNSPGGSVSAGLAIIDVMNLISSPVHTICIGMAASMGFMILISGEKGERYVTENSRIMLHQVSSGTRGKVADMQVDLEETVRLNAVLAKIIAERCGKGLKEVKKAMLKDTWLDGEAAIKFGAIDSIMKRRS
jgi:ATP-dependent Clp protease protease subunit